jgi:hypothetical protein
VSRWPLMYSRKYSEDTSSLEGTAARPEAIVLSVGMRHFEQTVAMLKLSQMSLCRSLSTLGYRFAAGRRCLPEDHVPDR